MQVPPLAKAPPLPDPPEEMESPFPRRLVFDFRWMSGQLIKHFDSDDPYWWDCISVNELLRRMHYGLFDWLPPLAKAPPPALGDVEKEYRLVYDGAALSGDWENIHLPFGATVHVLILMTEKKPVRDWSVGMRTCKDEEYFREKERRFEATAKG